MNLRKLVTYELLLLILIFTIAIGVRFYALGKAPLSDAEAEWALQALQIANPNFDIGVIPPGPNPGYVVLTGVLFALFGSSNFLARFWPALAGSILVLLPFLIVYSPMLDTPKKSSYFRWAAIICAFGLAVAPGLVTTSRLAGGPMMALGFSMLAVGLWFIRRPVLAGISAGIALVSGPAILIGVLGLFLAFLSMKLLSTKPARDSKTDEDPESQSNESVILRDTSPTAPAQDRDNLLTFITASAGCILIVSTMSLVYPQGLGAWFGSIPTFLNGWISYSGVPISRLLAALITYETFAILFCLTLLVTLLFRRDASFSANRSLVTFLIAWIFFSLLVVFIYPGRQVQDMVWVLVPLWALAAIGLANLFINKPVTIISYLHGLFILVLAGLLWYTIASITRVPNTGIAQSGFQLAIILGIFALGALTTALITLGWSWEISKAGLALGLTASLSLYLVSVLWSSAYTRQNLPSEMWGSTPAPEQASVMQKVLSEVSSWTSGTIDHIDILSIVDTPSLRWALRDFANVRFIQNPGRDELPSIVITREGQDIPSLAASYRGEDFVWWSVPGWSGAFPPDFPRWFAFREAPLIRDKIILWSRSDLYSSSIYDQGLLELPADNPPFDGIPNEDTIIEDQLKDDAR